MEPQFAPLTGIIADRYEIRREAGRGGMAVVYLAWDLRHDRAVALKLLSPELSATIGKARFLREIQIAAHLSHPNILAVLDSGLVDLAGGVSLPFYVMPFIEGENLAELLAAKNHLPTDEALRIAAEVADALHYAHGHGVIHRDIKPANILLQEGHALVADFGVARELEGTPGVVTSAGMVIGTVHYMSPEQLTGDPGLDGRSDVYALACVLYEMMAGLPPFSGATPQEICARHLTGEPRELRTIRPEITPAIQQVVARAMAKSVEERYASAGEFRDALTRLQNTGDTLPPSRRRRRPMSALALMLLGAAVFGIVAWWQRRPTIGAEGRVDSPAAVATTRILVPPLTATPDSLQLLGDAVTRSLIGQLQAIPQLVLTDFDMVAPFRNSPPDSLGQRFPADRWVSGSLTQHQDSLTVIARLVDPGTGALLSTMSWTTSVRTTPERIVDSLGGFIRQMISEEQQFASRRSQVSDASVWKLVEQANLLRRQASEALGSGADQMAIRALDKADSVLHEAQRRDPQSPFIQLEIARTAQSRAFLGEYVSQRGGNRSRALPNPGIAREAALSAVDQLLRSHPRNSEALELRGLIRLGLYRQTAADSFFDAAMKDFDLATTLDPGAVGAWRELSRMYLQRGRYPESKFAINQAVALDPFRLNLRELLRGHFEVSLFLQEFKEADADCQRGLREFHADDRFADCEVELLGRSQRDLPSAKRALALTDSLAELNDDTQFTAWRYLLVSGILARAGLGDSADRLSARASAMAGGPHAESFVLIEAANVRVIRGQVDSAVALIATAARKNPSEIPYLRNAPWFEVLRQNPRFTAALTGSTPREAAASP